MKAKLCCFFGLTWDVWAWSEINSLVHQWRNEIHQPLTSYQHLVVRDIVCETSLRERGLLLKILHRYLISPLDVYTGLVKIKNKGVPGTSYQWKSTMMAKIMKKNCDVVNKWRRRHEEIDKCSCYVFSIHIDRSLTSPSWKTFYCSTGRTMSMLEGKPPIRLPNHVLFTVCLLSISTVWLSCG